MSILSLNYSTNTYFIVWLIHLNHRYSTSYIYWINGHEANQLDSWGIKCSLIAIVGMTIDYCSPIILLFFHCLYHSHMCNLSYVTLSILFFFPEDYLHFNYQHLRISWLIPITNNRKYSLSNLVFLWNFIFYFLKKN